jgi:hypothetical protein
MGRIVRTLAIVLWVVVVPVALVGCGSSDDGAGDGGSAGPTGGGSVGSLTASAAPDPSISPTTPPASEDDGDDVSGTWSGTWQNTSPDHASGTFEATWEQDGSYLNGSIVVEGTPCLSTGEVKGVVANGMIQFGAVKAQSEIGFTGLLGDGDTMSGSYEASATCADATGNWTAEKTGD